jgi:hypothetical protein
MRPLGEASLRDVLWGERFKEVRFRGRGCGYGKPFSESNQNYEHAESAA